MPTSQPTPTARANTTVAIALATFHPQMDFFRHQIDSIKQQTWQDWFCVVSDDGSEATIQAQIAAVLATDSRFVFLPHQERVGVVKNFERALRKVQNQSEFVALCDQDDVWYPQKLEAMVKALQQSGAAMAHHDLRLVTAQGHEVAASCWQAEKRSCQEVNALSLVYKNVITGCSTVFKNSVLSLGIPIPKHADRPYFHDLWLAAHALRQGSILSVPTVLMDYRQHGSNVVGGGRKRGWPRRPLEQAKKAWKGRELFIFDFLKAVESNPLNASELAFYQMLFQRGFFSMAGFWRQILQRLLRVHFSDRGLWALVLGRVVQQIAPKRGA